MRLTTRFSVLVLGLLALIALVAVAGVRGLKSFDHELRTAVHGDAQRLLHVTHTRRLFRSMLVLERDYLIEADKRGGTKTKIAQTRKELREHIDAYAAIAPEADAAAVASLHGAADRWIQLDDDVMRLVDLGQLGPATAKAGEHAKDPVSWETTIGGLVSSSEKRFDERVRSSEAVYARTRGVLLGASGVAMLFAVVFGAWIFRGIAKNMRDIVEANQTLEAKVKERTESLAKKEADLRSIFDGTGDGLFAIDLSGRIVGEVSKAARTWFGAVPASNSASEYLYGQDQRRCAMFACGLEQIADGMLPLDLLLQQMPPMLETKGKTYAIAYRPMEEDGALTKILIVLSDVTERIQAELAASGARETQTLITSAIQDPRGFPTYVREIRGLYARISSTTDLDALKRDLHTLKGNAHLLGLVRAAEACHHIESQIAEDGVVPTDEIAALRGLVEGPLGEVEGFLSDRQGGVFLTNEQHQLLLDKLKIGAPHAMIRAMVEAWQLEPARRRLERLAAQVERVATSQGKRINVAIEDGNVMLPPGIYDDFWSSLVHIVRNAAYHGIEDESERCASGKAAEGTIQLSTRWRENRQFVLEIRDDGKGIDFARLREKLDKHDATENDLIDQILLGKVSSVDEANELAGRGVGVSAARAECERLAGRLQVDTKPGNGTTFRFSMPAPPKTVN
jgi:two-component system chemotaxis sensor kinase CheA